MSDDFIILYCPHCKEEFVVARGEINCAIFRHFVFKSGIQLNPHASEEECHRAVQSELGYGCAGPFRLTQNGEGWEAVACDYI